MESATDVEIDTKVGEIIQKIQLALEKLEKSVFYGEFVKQVHTPKMVKMIQRVIGADPNHSQMQLVLYGVGEMEPNDRLPDVESHHMQLCLAILLRKNFEWVHDVVVYDPALSPMEQKAINAFDCTCLSVNENGRRTVDRPTLFFMPRCDLPLYDNVLKANWTPANLNKIIILGNGFNLYEQEKEAFPYHRMARKLQAILESDHMLYEMPLPTTYIDTECVSIYWDGSPPPYTERLRSIDYGYRSAFNGLSWHFFDWDGSLHSFNTGEGDYAEIDNTLIEEVIKKIQISPEKLTDMHTAEKDKRVEEIMDEMVAELIKKIQDARLKLENSSFYRQFMKQMKNPEIDEGTDPKYYRQFQVVLHGIGLMEPYDGETSVEPNHMQLAFAILLREKFEWVTDIVLYHPTAISTVEQRAMNAFNCTCLCRDRYGLWSVDRPTIFFMPRCHPLVYEHLLHANWTPSQLKNIIILGKSFKQFRRDLSDRLFLFAKFNVIITTEDGVAEMPLPETAIKTPSTDTSQNSSTQTSEDVPIDPDPVYMKAFVHLSWHFFASHRRRHDRPRRNLNAHLSWQFFASHRRRHDRPTRTLNNHRHEGENAQMEAENP